MEHKHPLSFSTLAVILFLVNCSNYGLPEPDDLILSNWGKSTVDTAPDQSVFNATALDNQDNVYAVGYQNTTGTYGYGDGVLVTGACNQVNGRGCKNALIVKYSPDDGTTQWAKSTTTAPNTSAFLGVATDTNGNVYAVGYITGNTSYNYGNGVTVQGAATTGNNAVIVKYNSKGEAQWAKSTTTASSDSVFHGIAIDKNNNLYVAGVQTDSGVYNYGNSVTATGAATNGDFNAVVVKYNSNGIAQWAKTTVQADGSSWFYAITVDNRNNLYAVGYQTGSGTYDYGGATVNSASYVAASLANVVIVKYNSNGIAQWARSITSRSSGTSGNSEFQGVTTDRYGNVYAVGYQAENGAFYYGGLSKAISGSSSSTAGSSPNNSLLVKYNSDGQAQWAKTTTGGGNGSKFQSVATTFAGDIYAVGKQNTNDMYSYGDGVTAKGVSGVVSATIVAYNSLGTTQWAKTTVIGQSESVFTGIATNSNKLFVVGSQHSDSIYNYNNGVDIKAAETGSPVTYKAVATTFSH